MIKNLLLLLQIFMKEFRMIQRERERDREDHIMFDLIHKRLTMHNNPITSNIRRP